MTLTIWFSGLAVLLVFLFAVYWYAGKDETNRKDK